MAPAHTVNTAVQLMGWTLTKWEASIDVSILPGSETKLDSAPVWREWSGNVSVLKPDGRDWNGVYERSMDVSLMWFGQNYFALMFCSLLQHCGGQMYPSLQLSNIYRCRGIKCLLEGKKCDGLSC